jgi:putative transposase
MLCRVLGVSRSGYYDWTARGPSRRQLDDAAALERIEAIHAEFPYYGSPRMFRELLDQGVRIGRHRVARLLRENGLHARRGRIGTRKRSVPVIRRVDIVDVVQRQFTVAAPNRLWFTDLTMIRTGDGWLHAAVVLDAFNREVIAWATDSQETPRTALTALREAIKIRRPKPGCVIHSDRGYQFTSHDWNQLAAQHRITVSIGQRKDPRDNAVMESWFASFKNEELYPGGQPATRATARSRLFAYIWAYNTRRLHSSLGYRAPIHYN